jgi:hypothetical protein
VEAKIINFANRGYRALGVGYAAGKGLAAQLGCQPADRIAQVES